MFYLIDGYNLLYAMGTLHARTPPDGLERARAALFGFLKGRHGDEAARVTVVFDARRAPRGAVAEANYQGIQVYFAVGHDEADDLIELLIRRASSPRLLTVISDDHRIQQAGRRRRCPVLGCGDYLALLERRRRRPAAPPRSGDGKPAGVSRAEARLWLGEFAGLADDPALKELFDPDGFLEEEQNGGRGAGGEET